MKTISHQRFEPEDKTETKRMTEKRLRKKRSNLNQESTTTLVPPESQPKVEPERRQRKSNKSQVLLNRQF